MFNAYNNFNMDVIERYKKVFIETFKVSEKDLINGFASQNIDKWDSVAHLKLISELENEFDIMLDTDDLLELNSFEIGKKILIKYEIQI